ncbi:hypothetical protein PsYK624_121590 [Phanerochaete sordida]|uniref:Uncharacterized protein n=1 Tax=Phanerochaete sordida TaxID=48140 RepID=A0A9P3LHX1_9APHY|nr:hypothetical protein PsYK624_121590 [Phanerochaete sordida]
MQKLDVGVLCVRWRLTSLRVYNGRSTKTNGRTSTPWLQLDNCPTPSQKTSSKSHKNVLRRTNRFHIVVSHLLYVRSAHHLSELQEAHRA